MKYVYTDFGALPVSFTLTLDEIDLLIKFIADSESSDTPYFLSNLENLLLDSRKQTADLMESHAKSIRDKGNV